MLRLKMIALTLLMTACCAAGAIANQFAMKWTRSQVIPVVLVEPDFLNQDFQPVGTSLPVPPKWRKEDVLPVSLTTPNLAGNFEPTPGSLTIRWDRSNVKPVVIVTPNFTGDFEPYIPRR